MFSARSLLRSSAILTSANKIQPVRKNNLAPKVFLFDKNKINGNFQLRTFATPSTSELKASIGEKRKYLA